MPVPLLAEGLFGDVSRIPYLYTSLKLVPWLALLVGLKYFFGGARCRADRLMHGRVVMVTVRTLRLFFEHARLTSARAVLLALGLHLPGH